jgi:tetratricopeptide (TPR) repeat protein
MNKKATYFILIALFIATTAFVVIRYKDNVKKGFVAFYPLKERVGTAALLPEWTSTKTKGAELIRIVRETPEDTKSAIALATVYIQEARVTGNYTYYDAAAMKYIEDVLVREPRNFEALVLKALLQLSQHHFTEALQTASIANVINPYNAFIQGVMVDANVELGRYDSAVLHADRMISIRPDLRSYSRVAYLREIHGDYPGAIEAMKLAVDAGSFGDEATAWARVQLGKLYEQTGDLANAEMHYTIAEEQRPGYGYALAGLGSVALGKGAPERSIQFYQKAATSISDYALKEQLAQIYLLSGNKARSTALLNEVIGELKQASEEGEGAINHHADKELAYVYLLMDRPEEALKHALAEYNRRPQNIDVAEAVAWSYYKSGEVNEALPYIETALRTGSKSPSLLCHAGIIYAKTGNKKRAAQLLEDALKKSPNIDPMLKRESMEVAASLPIIN